MVKMCELYTSRADLGLLSNGHSNEAVTLGVHMHVVKAKFVT
jgi:hypothetical protein